MVHVDKQCGGTQEPLLAHRRTLLLQVMCRPRGFGGRCGEDCRAVRRPSDRALRFPSSGWMVSQGGVRPVPLLRWGLRAVAGGEGGGEGRSLPLRAASPQGARTQAFPTQPLCPQTSGNNEWGRGAGLLSSWTKSVWQDPRSRKD